MNEKQAVEDFFKEMFPDKEVEFADGAFDKVDDMDGFVRAVRRTTRRVQSRWLGWFWRWWYRPKPYNE